MIVTASNLTRDVGWYLWKAQKQVLAVSYHGTIAAYLISPEAYAKILQGHTLREDAHHAAVAPHGCGMGGTEIGL